ncbi:hypothetical protein CYLTODRAFT_490311 [Cylindrobasidium torrendii FP15055 ss-10]|uniref:BZIP domain-containing protein n=1 Tax=Cylindrobasidium torrendii FP15055 ss-10 TaxID=1314674 RepID=A0A0D7BE04_9AGAR|nr:hypothetical protein CYLTODRAFT_490311 [Cylindrobasidium torrendii FP15055 ss-10]
MPSNKSTSPYIGQVWGPPFDSNSTQDAYWANLAGPSRILGGATSFASSAEAVMHMPNLALSSPSASHAGASFGASGTQGQLSLSPSSSHSSTAALSTTEVERRKRNADAARRARRRQKVKEGDLERGIHERESELQVLRRETRDLEMHVNYLRGFVDCLEGRYIPTESRQWHWSSS